MGDQQRRGINAGRKNGRIVSIVLYIDIYIFHCISQTETLSVHFSSRKKVRLTTRKRRRQRSRENKVTKRRREVIPE